MKTVSGKIVSTKAVNLSKAANILSNFVNSDNGASQSVTAYLRGASDAFNELVYFKKHHKKSREEASAISDISNRTLEESEGKLRKKEKKKKSDGSFGKNENVELKSVENDEMVDRKSEEKKKKKKKRKNTEVDGGENGNLEAPERKKKRRKTEA